MIEYIKGNILNVTEGIIVQQVNCMGVMGAGLAKQIKDKWPNIYSDYKEKLSLTTCNKDLLGKIRWTKADSKSADYLYVASIFGQYDYGRDKRYTIYPALFKGLESVFEIAYIDKMPIYIPKGLGCGLAGGNWDFVEAYIQDLDLLFDKKIKIIIVEKE